MTVTVNPNQAKEAIKQALMSGLVVMLKGSPGYAKSSIVKQVAEDYNLKLIDVRLAQMEPTEISGFPSVQNGVAKYIPFNMFPLEGDELPEGKNGILIFMDEINSAPRATIAAAYKLILDRMVGQHHLHKNVAIVCAGNLATDKAIVNNMGTAMQSRLVHLNLHMTADNWIEWANKNNIDYRVKAYINFRPSDLHKFDPNHNEDTYACPRSWEFISKLIIGKEDIGLKMLPLLAGTVGEGMARSFIGFLSIVQNLPTREQILANPSAIKIGSEPSIKFALSGLIGDLITKANIDKLMPLVLKLPTEFQILCLKQAVSKDPTLTNTPAMMEIINKNIKFLT